MSEQEIKRCRFCGGLGRLERHKSGYYVECPDEDCVFMGPTMPTRERAIAAWNEVNTVPAEREEGVVAWMESNWRAGRRRECVMTEKCDHPDFTQRVRIIPEPEPEPRYAVRGWGSDGAKVVDLHDTGLARAYFDETHPNPWGAAHGEAARLNAEHEKEQEDG